MKLIKDIKNMFTPDQDTETPSQEIKPMVFQAPPKPSESTKNFCIMPFIHLATTTEGTCRLCCKVSKFDTINRPDGTPYNVNVDSIDDIWNSQHYQDIRARVLADEQLPECKTCWREEEIYHSEWSKYKRGELPSKRRKENQKWLHKEKTKLSEPVRDIIDIPRIRYFDIRLSNLCNLKCRMCWPHFSSQIVKEQKQFARDGLPTHYKNYDVGEWDTQQLWDGINANLVDIEEISFVGGEPTLHEEIYDLLQRLVDTGLSENIRLKFTTNLTNLQERWLQLFPSFKNIIINGSIDGVGETNDYIRHPSDWRTIEENIDRLIAIRRENFLSITLTPVIQIYNIFNVGEMIEWYVEKWLGLEYKKTQLYFALDLDLLYDPNYLSVNLLNATGKSMWYHSVFAPTIKYLEDVIENIETQSQVHQDQWSNVNNIRKKLVNIAQYMEVLKFNEQDRLEFMAYSSERPNPKHITALQQYTRQLDKNRNQSVYEIMPNFDEMIKHE